MLWRRPAVTPTGEEGRTGDRLRPGEEAKVERTALVGLFQCVSVRPHSSLHKARAVPTPYNLGERDSRSAGTLRFCLSASFQLVMWIPRVVNELMRRLV